MNYTIKNEFYEAEISSVGAELVSLKSKDGKELIWNNPFEDGWKSHAPLLFPFCGRLKDSEFIYKGKAYPMGIHGFISKVEFSLESSSADSIILSFKSDEKTRAIYPFDFSFAAAYTLSGDGLSLKVTVENTGKEELPYNFGWHPGFNLPDGDGQDIDDYIISFNGKKEIKRVLFEKDLTVPSKVVPYPLKNGEYKLSEEEIYKVDTMVFCEKGNGVRLYAEGYPYALDMSWSENLEVLCIWKTPRSDMKFICLEPWTHATPRGERANEIECRPMIRLESGKSESYEYNLKFSF